MLLKMIPLDSWVQLIINYYDDDGFLFAFHSNYGHSLYHFRGKAKYWSKIAIFTLALDAPLHTLHTYI